MKTLPTSQVRFFRTATLLLGLVTLTLAIASLAPTPAFADSNGNQISFAVAGGNFSYLRVSGLNQRNEWSVWEKTYSSPVFVDTTTSWWWKGSIDLDFYIVGGGWQHCFIEYLREPGSMNTVYITYKAGIGCSGGESGNGGEPFQWAVTLYQVLSFDDASEVAALMKDANDAGRCVAKIVRARQNRIRWIEAGWECGSASLEMVNGILIKYGIQIQQ